MCKLGHSVPHSYASDPLKTPSAEEFDKVKHMHPLPAFITFSLSPCLSLCLHLYLSISLSLSLSVSISLTHTHTSWTT